MKEFRGRRSTTYLLLASVLLGACAPPPATSPAVADRQDEPAGGVLVALPPAEGAAEGAGERAAAFAEPGTAVPVAQDDPSWGDPLAPVTLVLWGDYQCPFTARLMANLPTLQEKYGPAKLRIVWKHNPLPFHKNARPAHIAAETVLRLGGVNSFWRFHALAFANQRDLTPDAFTAWAAQSGVDPSAFEVAFTRQHFADAIDDDLALGKRVGVTGTPASFVNGVFVAGAQPIDKFQAVIDAQLAEAAALRRQGVPPQRIYAELSERNHKTPPPKPAPPLDTTVWKVPVDGSPVRGSPTALVTLVMFGDLECPFCKRAVPTITELEAKYGDKLRVVFKHNPLPMHPRAEAAAEFAIEAGAQKGEATFWKAHQALYDNQDKLEDTDLEDLARALGLDTKRVMKAIATKKHAARIQRDQDLAAEIQASGTPHFFVNGRRLAGAQPRERFEALIDEEIKKARQLFVEGTPAAKVYETLQKDAKAGVTMERILAPAPTKDNPGKGAPPGAAITVQMFADFQCPFCRRVQSEVDRLIAAYPGKVRVVWRHLPLSFHPHAQMAAEAAVEAFRQKGEAGFWAFSAKLWEAQSQGLDRAVIEQMAAEVGLDVPKLSAALDTRAHWKVVQADVELAGRLKISGTPGFVINDYFLSGAQPLHAFQRYVNKALKRELIAPDLLKADARQPVALVATVPPPFGTSPSSAPAPGAVAQVRLGAKHLLVMYAGSMRAPAHITRTRDEAIARAEEARKRVLGGAKFEDVVAQYSDEPGAAKRGGDLGTFPPGAMVKPFQDTVEALNVGQMSGVVETAFGFHIIVRTQ
ncbi:thioredoxin domain-containing protein [Polyangium spumosum]|uniref:Thioredoxin domain-containing protein n=1 Tax=Polyangium spumosum TaxID=889282 RepID=A0A6N7PNX7_9BACT|nr:thioredoxin domain-containing protein [Polyangium spumosum]MRG93639.1 thioredoxin domain-containing protein [Polyangium spumosum]